MKLEIIMSSKIIQTQKDKYRVFSIICRTRLLHMIFWEKKVTSRGEKGDKNW
jgi:hypothetical protein